jgi:vacuolar protein sorting-associated protein 35
MMHADTAAEDEEKWLAEGIAGVQQNAYYMHRALVSPNASLNLSSMLSVVQS